MSAKPTMYANYASVFLISFYNFYDQIKLVLLENDVISATRMLMIDYVVKFVPNKMVMITIPTVYSII